MVPIAKIWGPGSWTIWPMQLRQSSRMSEYDLADGILSYIIGETENILAYNRI